MNGNLAQIIDDPSGSGRRHSVRRRAGRRGLTLIEAMVLMVVMSIVSVGVSVGLQSAVRIPEGSDRILAVSGELTSELENWRAVAWTGSTWPTTLPYSASDTVTLSIGGQSITYNRTTTIKIWDPNDITGNSSPQVDFVQVRITIDSQSTTAYLTKPT